MSYVIINGDETRYNVQAYPFTTQHGIRAMRFEGDEIPETDMGFKYYFDDDTLISDLSEYIYLYRPNEYSVELDEQILPKWVNEPLAPSAIDRLNSRVSQLSSQVSAITPYTESKTAYIDDTQVSFNIAKEGNISVFMVDGDGQNVPFTYEQVNGQIVVSFEKRDSLATVTISIQ